MIIPIILFYLFSFMTIASAFAVVASRNPVYSVMFLILTFFNVAGLFVLLGAELLAMILVIVYVGAVAVLFLFVVMMLNINIAKVKEGFLKYMPLGLIIAVILFVELFLMIESSVKNISDISKLEGEQNISNAEAIGNILYTDYILLFQLSGLILLVAMIGAIILTHRKRSGVRKQSISKQLGRKVKDTIDIVKIASGTGINGK